MAIKPAGHRVLVIPDPVETKTASGIIMTTDVSKVREEQSQIFGVVHSVGATAFKDFGSEPWCKEGDHIAFAKYGGFVIQDPTDGKEYRLLNDEDVCAVITEE
jgi:chaperonin GroES